MLQAVTGAAWADAHRRFTLATGALLDQADRPLQNTPAEGHRPDTDDQAAAYEDLKSALLAAGARGELPLADMEQALRRCSALRRAAQQAVKARQRLAAGGAAAHEPGPAGA
jgi:phosphate:Na+ symporter